MTEPRPYALATSAMARPGRYASMRCRSGRRRIGMGGTVGRESIGIRHQASARAVPDPPPSPLAPHLRLAMDHGLSTIDCATHISHSDAPSGSPRGFWCRRESQGMKGSDHTMPTVKPYRRRAVALTVLTVFSLTQGMTPAFSIDEEEVEQARLEREEAALARAAALTDLDSAVASYEAINAELEELTFRVGRLRSQIDLYEGRTRDLRQVIRDRAVNSYMHGDERGTLASVLTPRLRSNRSSPGGTGPRRRHRFLVTRHPGGDDE